jgi:mannose-6-phosphate isomerase-like protein (cupin superfamily)
MIVRNLETEEVRHRWYVAHGGGMATMLFDATELQGILFMAHAVLKPNRVLESHIDPYEEIYYIIAGQGLMKVGNDEQQVATGDAIWIPYGVSHSLTNNSGTEDCLVLVTAAMPKRDLVDKSTP